MKNVFIISGPAGSGKDAVIEGLKEAIPFERVITTTTRPIRPGESEGKPYHFVSPEEFEKKVVNGEFVEYSTNENNERYGVTKEEIDRVAKLKLFTLWKMDWKGVVSAKKLFPGISALLITAPLSVLEDRLRRRDGKTKDKAYFTERMNYTREWMRHIDIYDYIVENEEGRLDQTIEKVKSLIEKHLAH